MADARWTIADARKYLAGSGRQLAPGSMALEGEETYAPAPAVVMPVVPQEERQHAPCWPYRSRVEQRYAATLTERQRTGQVERWWFEPLKLRLGEKCYYTADFLVIETARPQALVLVETKGPYVRDDSVVKTKTAARMYPCFVFLWVQWKQQVWTQREIRPV